MAVDTSSTHSDLLRCLNDNIFLQCKYDASFVLQTVNVTNDYVVTEKIQ